VKDAIFDFIISTVKNELKNALVSKKQPKYQNLYQILKNKIITIEFPYNWSLPPTRTLANSLQYSRSTIVKAYEMLLLENLVESRTGSSYRIIYKPQQVVSKKKYSIDITQYPKLSERGQSFLDNYNLLNRPVDNSIAFQPGLPPIDIFPLNKWKKLIDNYWKYIKSSELSYSQASGKDLLKKQISNYLKISRNIHCSPEQIIVVSGSLQSLYLLSTALINKGDQIILENPTFPNVHSVFKSSLAKLIPLPLDSQGIDLTKLDNHEIKNLKIIHVTPNNHYPFGLYASKKRKQQLIDLAKKHNTYIVENDYEHEIINNPQIKNNLFNFDKSHRTIYLGTFNRLLFPSIRLGYMVLPKHLVNAIESLQEHSHRFVAPIAQMVMSQFIEKNHLYSHFKNLKTVAKERSKIFTQWHKNTNTNTQLVTTENNSLHKVLLFDDKITLETEEKIQEHLLKKGISAYRLSTCFIDKKTKTGLIIGYATVAPSVMKQKLTVLASVLNEYL